jgi:glycosyltransferase involved in cell wall biosynthesis
VVRSRFAFGALRHQVRSLDEAILLKLLLSQITNLGFVRARDQQPLEDHNETESLSKRMLRLAIITNAPAPYRDPLYRALGEHFEKVHVYYADQPDQDRAWIVDEGCETTRLRPLLRLGPIGTLHAGLVRVVRDADVIYVGGYDKLTYVLAMVAGRLAGRRVVLFFDGIAPSRLHRRGFKHWVKRQVVRLPQVCLVNGTIGRRYFQDELGVSPDRIRNQYLVPTPASPPLGGTPPVDVLFVGRLVERKGAHTLIEALRMTPGLQARIVGDGPERVRLERAARGLPVEFVGELSRDEIDEHLRSAHSLVVPSRDEPWGLVVQEAIQCDVAVAVSSDVGAAWDLVCEGQNGVVFAPADPRALVDAVRGAMSLDRAQLRSTNEAILAEWSIDAYVAAFVSAIPHV